MNKRIAIAAAAALVSCGGSSWVDPTTGNFTASDSTEVMSMLSTGMSAMARQPAQQLPLQNSKALTETVTNQVSCAVSGTVTVAGSVDSSCNGAGTSCSFSGNLSVAFADCTSQNGLKGNGGLYATASGSEATSGSTTTFSVTEHIWGGITVVRTSDGSTIGTCGVNVTATVSSDGTTETVHVSGTVCKQSVAQ
jgi:hypothetical protein